METKTTKDTKKKVPAYTIFLPVDQTNGEKKPWPRRGVIFGNRDNSLNILFDDGTRFQARPYRAKGKA